MADTIPQIIHYCWFGKNPKPKMAIKCIESWKKFFPGYEIKEWNEENFDLNCCNYVKEAYQAKKWAFVSDYARFKILYENGGLYFDTDVEVIKSFEPILKQGPFMGSEKNIEIVTDSNEPGIGANAGLGIGAYPGMAIYKEILTYYEAQHFIRKDGSMNLETIVTRVTNILRKYGYKGNGEIENVKGINIYPPKFFCPIDYMSGVMSLTDETFSIHHYGESWHTRAERIVNSIDRYFIRRNKRDSLQRKIVVLPFWLYHKIETRGIKGTVQLLKKIRKKDSINE